MEQTFIGIIVKWDEARGFGFIKDDATGIEIFAHITDFKKRAIPKIGERVSFGIEIDRFRRKKAHSVVFMDRVSLHTFHRTHVQKAPYRKRVGQGKHRSKAGSRWITIGILAIFFVSLYMYTSFEKWHNRQQLTSQPAIPIQSVNMNVSFRCDGRQYCSQMTSCEEAKFFINNCHGTKMDGNHNGIPCEEQWCR